MGMKVLVIGGGGREHAIVWKLSGSPKVDKIFCAPGNAGISELAECIDIDVSNHEAILDFVKYEWVDLTIVGPEGPLSNGIVDAFVREGKRIMGPNREAARLESSKSFCKDFMRRHGIPTAEYKVCTSLSQAEDYVRLKGAPIVVKADGLAAGKGVIVADTQDEAFAALRLIMKDRAFGAAGDKVVIEALLEGEETSYMVFCDGRTMLPMVSSQDHKRIFDGDMGPNTGGMGAYSPAPIVTPEVERRILDKVMYRMLHGFRKDQMTFKGILYAGLMIKDGEPSVLEFNCRMGDPETQPIMMRMESDLVDIAGAVIDGTLDRTELKWRDEASVCVVAASEGYPGEYPKGREIEGLKEAGALEGVTVFHAGTAMEDGRVVTSGGRVLGITAVGADIRAARRRAYEAASRISFEGMQYRTDISDKALAGEGIK